MEPPRCLEVDVVVLVLVLGSLAARATVLPPVETGDSDSGDSSPVDTGLVIDTSDSGLPPPTVDTTDVDTGPVFCPDCRTASDLANEPGGYPCDEGSCSSTGAAGSVLPVLLMGLVAGSRRRR